MHWPFFISIQTVTFITAFLIALVTGPILIPILARLKFGQVVRDDGPATHLKKTGTPTMGGLVFLMPILLLSIYFSVSGLYPELLPMMLVTVGFGAVGLVDDLIKVVKKRKDGLYAGQKMFGLLIIASAYTYYIYRFTDLGTSIIVPFAGRGFSIDLGWLFIPFTIFVFLATTNCVNLTDGLDGLLGGISLIVMLFFAMVAATKPEWDYVKVFSATVAGGCMGFLVFNLHPARIFMGDAGSLALGGAIGAAAVMMKMPLVILVAGLVFVIEGMSVMIQVAYYKKTRKRVFKMAPIHHHFELSGWKETKVVYVLWLTTAVLCLIAFLSLGI